MPGPNSTDANFEKTFSDLAFARLRDKAPTLLDHLIGFQLIDKNDDETHAVGVFGFKIGNEWVYAPVFFINGELKGHELLYIKSQDAFVPMTEEWTNYILNRRPSTLGERETTPRNELPIRQPDFDVFARAPYIGSKYAGHKYSYNDLVKNFASNASSDWVVDFMPNFLPEKQASTHVKFAALNKRFDLCYATRTLGKRAVASLVGTMRKHSGFADAILTHYNFEDLADFEKRAEKLTQEEAGYREAAEYSQCKDCEHSSGSSCSLVEGSIKGSATCNYFSIKTNDKDTGTGADNPLLPKAAQEELAHKVEGTMPEPVVIVRGDDPSNVMHGLTDSDKEKLLQNNYVVKDERSDDQRSRLYKSQINQSLQSPSEAGYYEITSSPGECRKFLVITAPKNIGRRDSRCAIVIDPDTKRFGSFYTSDLLVSKQLESEEWEKTFESKFESQDNLKEENIAILVGPKMESTTAFRVDKKWVNQNGQTEMEVHNYHMAGSKDRGLFHGSRTHEVAYPEEPQSDMDQIDKIMLTGKEGVKANIIGSTIFIPKSWKSIKLPKEFRYSMGNTLDLPSMPDVVLNLYKSALAGEKGAAALKLRTDGIGYALEHNGKRGVSMTKLSMLRHLICNQGLGQEDAEHLVKTASPRKAELYFVKYAADGQPGRAHFPEPILTEDPDLQAKVTYPQVDVQNIGEIDNQEARYQYGSGANDRFVDPTTRQNAIDASSSGQKEVLDTAVISGLIKTMDTDNLVDSYIGDLLLGLDRIGRILFLFYWHNEKFKDRYGQQDLIELEDNLRNVFTNLGELSLFLKQKTIEPEESDSSEVELTDVMG